MRGPFEVRAESGLQAWALVAGVAVLGAAAWLGGNRAGWFEGVDAAVLEGATVQRGPLRITATVGGSLEAADSVSLICEVEGRTTILSLAPEGSRVQKGDVVCVLDASALVESRLQQSIDVSNAEASLVKARQSLQIQESENFSDLAMARQDLEFARQDLQKFLEGERNAQLTRAQQAIDLSREEMTRASDRLAWSEKLVTGGFLTATELEADRIARNRAQVELEQALLELDLLERFQIPRTEAELKAAVEEAEREQQRVELQAKARLVDFEAALRASEARLELEQERLARIEGQIEKAIILAPRDGMLVYRQFDHDELPIQEGRSVRERQTLMYIPSAEGMIAEAKVHESVLEQIEVGQPCVLSVDALRGRRFEGKVSFVALLPDQNSWWSNPNTRLYRTEIEIVSPEPGLRPGMSCSVEILIEELSDALFVPVQTVFQVGQQSLCYVVERGEVETRRVRTGRFNELWVQILEGLEEGETVLLQPPQGTRPSAAPRAPEEEPAAEQGFAEPAG